MTKENINQKTNQSTSVGNPNKQTTTPNTDPKRINIRESTGVAPPPKK
jgi:hypothetical protein